MGARIRDFDSTSRLLMVICNVPTWILRSHIGVENLEEQFHYMLKVFLFVYFIERKAVFIHKRKSIGHPFYEN